MSNLNIGAFHGSEIGAHQEGAGDIIAPILTLPGTSSVTSHAGQGDVTTDEAGGTLRIVVSTNATAPNATQIKAGQDSTGSAAAYAGNQTVSVIGAQAIAFSGLADNTTYYAFFLQTDAANNDSNIAESGSFTTQTLALTSASLVQGVGPTAGSHNINTSHADGTLWRWVTTNASELVADVKTNGTNAAVSASGAQGAVIETPINPGTAYYAHFVYDDAGGNQVTAVSAPLTTTNYAVNNIYSGAQIPSDSLLYYAGGTADSGSTTTMVDAGLVTVDDEFNGLVIENRTDVTEDVITDSDAGSDTITYAGPLPDFTGGGDTYAITANIDNPDVMYCQPQVTVASESATILWYMQDDSLSTYTVMYTYIINATGLDDGPYDVAIDAVGVITLTPATSDMGAMSHSTSRGLSGPLSW